MYSMYSGVGRVVYELLMIAASLSISNTPPSGNPYNCMYVAYSAFRTAGWMVTSLSGNTDVFRLSVFMYSYNFSGSLSMVSYCSAFSNFACVSTKLAYCIID